VGLSAELYGPTKWTCIQDYSLFAPETSLSKQQGVFTAPTSFNLSLYGDYHVNKTCTVYAEVNNVLGDVLPTYRWAFYREMGASFTVGVKLQF
jgi:endo-beta-N-acetylglucosaminidase D